MSIGIINIAFGLYKFDNKFKDWYNIIVGIANVSLSIVLILR